MKHGSVQDLDWDEGRSFLCAHAMLTAAAQEDCIPPHIDHHDFSRPFCTISLLSEQSILFGQRLIPLGPGQFGGSDFRIPLPPGALSATPDIMFSSLMQNAYSGPVHAILRSTHYSNYLGQMGSGLWGAGHGRRSTDKAWLQILAYRRMPVHVSHVSWDDKTAPLCLRRLLPGAAGQRRGRGHALRAARDRAPHVHHAAQARALLPRTCRMHACTCCLPRLHACLHMLPPRQHA